MKVQYEIEKLRNEAKTKFNRKFDRIIKQFKAEVTASAIHLHHQLSKADEQLVREYENAN